MPALPPAAQCVLVRLKGTYGTGVWNNVLHLQYSGAAPTVADLTTVGSSIGTAWVTNIAPLAATTVVLTGMDLADLTNQAASATSLTFNNPGTRAGTVLTAATAMVSSWIINVRYRGGHPRTYWPVGVQADTTSARLWAPAFVTSATNAFGAFRTAVNAISASGTSYKMIALSYVHDGAPRPTPVPFTINGVTVHGRVDTQRHRLGRETP